jgi:protein ImuA
MERSNRLIKLESLRAAPADRVRLGVAGPDQALQGGLDRQRVHEICPEGVFHAASAAGFALALAARTDRGGDIVWIQQRRAVLEGGAPYGPGLSLFNAAPLLLVQTDSAKDALWAMEESLRCAGVAAVICELAQAGEAADLTATRRLNLAAEGRNALPLLLRHLPLRGTSACASRWRVRAAPGRGDGMGGIGRTAFALTLEKNRQGPCGAWHLEWDHEQRIFAAALPVAVAATARHRPHHAA